MLLQSAVLGIGYVLLNPKDLGSYPMFVQLGALDLYHLMLWLWAFGGYHLLGWIFVFPGERRIDKARRLPRRLETEAGA